MEYIGNELELFLNATNWKQYYGKIIRPYLKQDVMEVGAGIGATTVHLCNGSERNWVCVEPDPALAKQISDRIANKALPPCCSLFIGTLEDYKEDTLFDSLIYIDVIEHIEDDKGELERAKKRIKPGGHLIVLVPAHQWLYSPFDKAIGHFRRYNKKRLLEAIPSGFTKQKLMYLDSTGMFASVTNKLFFKQSYPTKKQVTFWDSTLVPLSRISDVIFMNSFGKSLLGIWRKN